MKINYSSNPILVKQYVKQFIEAGNSIKPFILQALYSLFTKPELNTPICAINPDQCVKLPLPEKVFMRGFYLTPKNTELFNLIMEGYIKLLFECELEANIRRSIKDERKFSTQEMILDLRKKFMLDEENFPYETIKKSLQRFCERENIDIQLIKIYSKNVPKKAVSVQINSICIPRKEFMSKFNVSHTTYASMKNEKGLLSVVKKGKNDYVNLALSQLSPIYTMSVTDK